MAINRRRRKHILGGRAAVTSANALRSRRSDRSTCWSFGYCRASVSDASPQGRGCGVGRGLGNGVDLGVAVGVGVTVGLGIGVAGQ
jgi:hypothetical protein